MGQEPEIRTRGLRVKLQTHTQRQERPVWGWEAEQGAPQTRSHRLLAACRAVCGGRYATWWKTAVLLIFLQIPPLVGVPREQNDAERRGQRALRNIHKPPSLLTQGKSNRNGRIGKWERLVLPLDHLDNPVTMSCMPPSPEDVDRNTQTWILGRKREVGGKGQWVTPDQ